MPQVAPGQPGRPAGPLLAGQVHAWLVRLDEQHAPGVPPGVLGAAERDRVQRFASAADGMRFAAARSGLRQILAGYLGMSPALLPLRTSGNGRPALAGEAGDELDFSLSRSRDIALVAVSTGPVGADIETLVPRSGLSDVARTRFPAAEAAGVTAGCCGTPLHSFYRHWTAKEAYLKLTGLGIAGLRRTEFDCGRAVGAPTVRFDGQALADLFVSELDVSPGHVATVVASRVVTSLRLLEN